MTQFDLPTDESLYCGEFEIGAHLSKNLNSTEKQFFVMIQTEK